MSDSKLSALTAATIARSQDLLYLVQSGASKSATVATLFSGMANVSFGSNVRVTSQETVIAPGAISPVIPVTQLQAISSGGTVTLAAGNNGQIKTIAMTANAAGNYTLSANMAGNATVVFSKIGHTASLMFLANLWYVTGGTANVTIP